MGCELEGFKSFQINLDKMPKEVETMIYIANSKNAFRLTTIASSLSPIKTGTLKKSWNFNYDECINQQGQHEIITCSDPDIIATNPNHPNGEYYSDKINYGFTKQNGDWYEGKYMLENSIDIVENEMIETIEKHLDSAFNELFGGDN